MLSKRVEPRRLVMISLSVILFTFLVSPFLVFCLAKDTITFDTLLRDDETKDCLVSEGNVFELGFFSPNGSSDNRRRFVGIWYHKSSPETVVWVANRVRPVLGTGGVFSVSKDGNLKVLDKTGETYWSTKNAAISSSPAKISAKLMDSGNLVLSSGERILWQSFENPADTFLPGMTLDENIVLTSWRSRDDPGPGNFTFQQDQERKNQVIILRRSVKYWNSGVSGRFMSINEMPPAILFLLSNFTSKTISDNYVPHLTSSLYKNTRLVMSVSGQIQYMLWNSQTGSSGIWAEPRDKCSVYNACGNFGSCDSNNNLACKCLPGFRPISPENWKAEDYSGGCARKTTTCSKVSEADVFLDLKMMKVGNPDSQFNAESEAECRIECLNNCQCQAYLYEEANVTRDGGAVVGPACWIWSEELNNLQEEYDNGRNLHVRVAISDIDQRSCATCGTNLLPYPLSTKPKCGDPSYDSFRCNVSDGQVNFETLNGRYKVTSINPDTRTFFVRIKDVNNCKNFSSTKYPQLNQSSPFHVMSGCNSKDGVELEISWNPPAEPTCSSSADCHDWPDSSCDPTNRCLCNKNLEWDSFGLKCAQVDAEEGGRGFRLMGIIVATLISVGVLVTIYYVCCLRKRLIKRQGRSDSRRSLERNSVLQMFSSKKRGSGQFKEDDTKGIEVPFFDLETVLSATDCFSNANKLGQGGFGPVHKGKLPEGEEIAVKRLSSGSGQGHEEFKNEVLLIAKLQHRNLVRLLGYCAEAEERMLIYEYMANKSLDSFIFDRKLCVLLDWDTRFNVILGIARGLLYLHHDSRLRIIHRDLKTSNILLDQEMNPKISDFGLARIFCGDETAANTRRVVGTYGYMSPEYALDGLFSLKSDVFSFGVVVIEIVTGKRNTGFYDPEQALSLLGYAWHLWKKEKAVDLAEQTLGKSLKKEEFLKCISVGLLCVQEDPNDRPTMSDVVFMLGSETATLPTPKQPAFVVRRCTSSAASSSSKPETCSHNELTVTLEVGR